MHTKRLNKLIYIFFFLFYSSMSSGQEYYFNTHPVSNEIVRKNPTCIYRKNKGFLYIGTQEGLIVYDGQNFDHISRKNDSIQWVTHLYDDGRRFWVGYQDGAIYTLQGRHLIPWNIDEGWPRVKITAIQKGDDDILWISTYGEGLYGYSENRLFNINHDDGLESDDIYDMAIDKDNKVYIATDFGLYVCQYIHQKKLIRKWNSPGPLNKEIIYKLKYDPVRHSMHCLTYSGIVYKIDLENQEIKMVTDSTLKFSVFEKSHHATLAVSSDSRDLYSVSELGGAIEKTGITGLEERPEITHMLYDSEHILWLICNNNGLLSTHADFKLHSNGIANTQAIIRVGSTIFSGNDQGLFRLQAEGLPEPVIKGINVLTLFYEKSLNELWVGTFGNGLYILNLENGSVSTINENNGLINNNVFSITNYLGDIWISGLAGIQRWSKDKKILSFWNKTKGLASDYNYVLFPDSRERLWIGSDGAGINYFDKNLNIFKVGKNETITSFAEDGAGKIWYCEVDKGTGYIQDRKMVAFDARQGLSESHISGIMSDFEGHILVFHHTGIDKINFKTHMVQVKGDHMGIRKWNQNINAFYKYPGQVIYLTNHSDWIEFTPQRNDDFSPLLIIKDVYCGNISLADKTSYVLNHDDNDFVIEYSGVNFSDPNHVHYRYKLSPLDSEWRYTKDKKLYYKNLSPGTYNFSIQCGNNLTFDPSKTLHYSFSIKKPFWSTVGFYIFILIIFTSILYYYFYTKSKKARYLKQIQTDQIKNQLDTLKSQINPHFLFNSFNTLISTIERSPEAAVVFVEKLSDFYRNILQYRDYDTITIEEELNILQDYIFLLHQRFRENLTVSVHLDTVKGYRIIPMTLQLLLENAVKHNIISTKFPLKINLYTEGSYIIMKNNRQLKLNQEKSTQFGLHSLKKRYENISQKSIVIEDSEKYFIVKIPLIES